MKRRERKVLEKGIGYMIYLKDGIYFLEIDRKFAIGFDKFESACESAKYQGLRG